MKKKPLTFKEFQKILREYERENPFITLNGFRNHVLEQGYTHYLGRLGEFKSEDARERSIRWRLHTGRFTKVADLRFGIPIMRTKGAKRYSKNVYVIDEDE